MSKKRIRKFLATMKSYKKKKNTGIFQKIIPRLKSTYAIFFVSAVNFFIVFQQEKKKQNQIDFVFITKAVLGRVFK